MTLTGQLYVDKGSMARVIAGSNSPVASIAGHGTRVLAAVGLALAANDIVGQYRQGVGAGTGRLTRVADQRQYELPLGDTQHGTPTIPRGLITGAV